MTRKSQDGTRPEGAWQAGDETAAEAGTETGTEAGAAGSADAAATGDAAGSTELEPLPESVEIPAAEDASAESASSQNHSVNGSRAGTTWVALIIGAVVLVLLLLFILQNLDSVRLQMFVWEWNFPIGVGMLIAAIGGALVMACVGGVRMIQLRRQISHPDREKKSKKSKKKSRRKR